MAIAAKNAARLSGTKEPGFNHALRLARNHMDPEHTSWDKNEQKLTSRYKVTPELCLNGKSLSVSTNLAIIDEHTTLAMFGAKPKTLRPGVSVQLQANIYQPSLVGTEVHIVSSVTRMGRNLAFVSAELIGADGSVHCRGSQVKFLPVDNMIMDYVLSSPSSWHYIKAYFDRIPNTPRTEHDISLNSLIDSHLLVDEPGVATFDVMRQHTNPYLGLHGGCHAMLMELVGQQLADDILGGPCELSSMQVEYHTVAKDQIDIRANVLSQNEDEIFMRVLILRPADGKIISDGSLRWKRHLTAN